VLASSCTGAFLLAEAGVLDGRRATTHWVAAAQFQARYPSVDLAIEHVVIDEGPAITSGGATTALNLVHYLVYRFGSPDRARAATQMMLLDSGRSSQLPFAMVGLHREHDDQLVHHVQSTIQQGLVDMTVGALADAVGVTPRTLGRRFQQAVGMSPKAYLDEVRIESAKRMLEQTSMTVDRIRVDVGFADPTAFRRAFMRMAGATPTEYRRRFAGAPTRSAGAKRRGPLRGGAGSGPSHRTG
jgi:transcriptional regulator GlxA family with amidase domain